MAAPSGLTRFTTSLCVGPLPVLIPDRGEFRAEEPVAEFAGTFPIPRLRFGFIYMRYMLTRSFSEANFATESKD